MTYFVSKPDIKL